MDFLNYFSILLVPFIIGITIVYGIKEKQDVYKLFLEGVKEGIETVLHLFPTILAIFLVVGMVRSSGLLNIIINNKLMININRLIPGELLPLALFKPLSGSAAIATGTDIIKKFGVDSLIGRMAATIMGSTETTLYVVSVYTSSINIKKTRNIVIIALIADFVGIITSILVCKAIF